MSFFHKHSFGIIVGIAASAAVFAMVKMAQEMFHEIGTGASLEEAERYAVADVSSPVHIAEIGKRSLYRVEIGMAYKGAKNHFVYYFSDTGPQPVTTNTLNSKGRWEAESIQVLAP